MQHKCIDFTYTFDVEKPPTSGAGEPQNYLCADLLMPGNLENPIQQFVRDLSHVRLARPPSGSKVAIEDSKEAKDDSSSSTALGDLETEAENDLEVCLLSFLRGLVCGTGRRMFG